VTIFAQLCKKQTCSPAGTAGSRVSADIRAGKFSLIFFQLPAPYNPVKSTTDQGPHGVGRRIPDDHTDTGTTGPQRVRSPSPSQEAVVFGPGAGVVACRRKGEAGSSQPAVHVNVAAVTIHPVKQS